LPSKATLPGRGTTVLVSGEAGIGKTWLLLGFAAEVASTARVFLGTCEDLSTPRTLGSFRDMARDWRRRCSTIPPSWNPPSEVGCWWLRTA
jgi:predicted ATPase